MDPLEKKKALTPKEVNQASIYQRLNFMALMLKNLTTEIWEPALLTIRKCTNVV